MRVRVRGGYLLKAFLLTFRFDKISVNFLILLIVPGILSLESVYLMPVMFVVMVCQENYVKILLM